MNRGRYGRVTGTLCVLAVASLGWALPAAAAPATADTAAPSPIDRSYQASSATVAPSPVYPKVTQAPAPTAEPYRRGESHPGNIIASDGRVIPGMGTLTESLDQAVIWELDPHVDGDHLIHLARSLPLDGRKIMLTVDVAERGADRAAMTEDARATADAMVTEVRTGMPLEDWTPGSDQRPRLDPGWVMLTVMLPASGGTEEPVTVLELGESVEPKGPESVANIERAGHDELGQGLLTNGLEEAIIAAIDETVPPPRGAWTEQPGDRPVLLASLLLFLVAIAVVPRVLARRRRRRAVTAHAADPSWYQDSSADPALRLRRIVEALALALDAGGARDLPSAREAMEAIIEHTLELDRVAPRSREGLSTAGWAGGRAAMDTRADDAAALLDRLVAEARRARPRVRLPEKVHHELDAQSTTRMTVSA